MSENDADGSFLHEHWNSDLRLFSYDENGAYNLLQVRHIISMFHLFDKLASNFWLSTLYIWYGWNFCSNMQISLLRNSECTCEALVIKPSWSTLPNSKCGVG